MSSKAAIARINGSKSNGLTSSRVVLPHESQEDYDKLEASFTNRFKPFDVLETELVHEMAAARWRLRRIESMESALFKKAIREQKEAIGPDADDTEIHDAAYAEVAESKSYRMLVRHAAQLRRSYEKAWRELELIQEQRVMDQQEDDSDELQNEPRSLRELDRQIHALMAMPAPRQNPPAQTDLSMNADVHPQG